MIENAVRSIASFGSSRAPTFEPSPGASSAPAATITVSETSSVPPSVSVTATLSPISVA